MAVTHVEAHVRAEAGQLAVTYRVAGQKLAVCERTIWGLVRDGELRSLRIGRSVRIPVAELDRYITAQTTQG
jgi:excisionase family DNA binding protein